MSDLSNRIEKIKPYFITFNISAEDDAAYVVVKLPPQWSIPDTKALKENFKVEVAPMSNGICFASEIKNGTDCIFDAVDYIIDFNKRVEERRELLKQKAEELKNLFASETLDKLKTLTFVFESEQEEPKKRKGAKKVVTDASTTAAEVESQANSITQEECEDTPLMAMAKNIAED